VYTSRIISKASGARFYREAPAAFNLGRTIREKKEKREKEDARRLATRREIALTVTV